MVAAPHVKGACMDAVTRPEDTFDFRAPDYDAIFRARIERLTWLRSGKPNERAARMTDLRAYYAENPADFITDWAVTVDPRNAEKKLPVLVPFILFPRQRELVADMLKWWREGTGGLVDKSRDVGASWVGMALSLTMCLFHRDFMAGVGSAKEDKADRSGDPDTLFYKGRHFLTYLPPDFTYGWDTKKHSAHLRIVIPHMGSSVTGEAGDNMGRGGRKSWYLVDEAAHIERPKLVDAALAATTNCRIDMSSVNGMANAFAEKRHSGKVPVFTFSWRDDPRKDDAWYAKQCEKLDPIIVAQEIDLDYSASVEGQIIPSKWVQLAVDAHTKLDIKPTGGRFSAFDVADEGKDKCAWGWRQGVLLNYAETWSGKGGDTLDSTHHVHRLCDSNGVDNFTWDEDGLGITVKSDTRVVQESRKAAKLKPIRTQSFRGSGAVLWPEQKVPGSDNRNNEDFFYNYKAQCWWALRRRFAATVRALEGKPYNPDDIISISSAAAFKERGRLMVELSQPVWKWNTTGKMLVDKAPEGSMSPNLADMVMMLYAPVNRGIVIAPGTADRLGAAE